MFVLCEGVPPKGDEHMAYKISSAVGSPAGGLRSRRLATQLTAAMLAVTALVMAPGEAQAVTGFDKQLSAPTALFLITGPDHAAAQQFVTGHSHVRSVSAFLASDSSDGALDAQIRTDVTDPASAVADSQISLAQLGAGSGWVNFPVDVRLTPGKTYYLVIEAVGTAQRVVWNGVVSGLPSALPAWNYDRVAWGGWKAYDSGDLANLHPAFGIELSKNEDCSAMNTCYRSQPPGQLVALTAGLLGNGQTTVALSPFESYQASYVDNSNILRLPNGQWRYLPVGATAPVTVPGGSSRAMLPITKSGEWPSQGSVPGRGTETKAVAKRALLSMWLLTQPNGAVAAAWYEGWKYSWPRDSSFVAVAFAHTGHLTEAESILQYNARTQRADGTWDARTLLDGSGPPDDRQWQLDANGWFPWSVWQWYQAAPSWNRDSVLASLYPAVSKAATYAANSLDDRGLPPAGPDYWEVGTSTTNIGTAAPLLSGLDASADLARALGHWDDARAWNDAARRLAAGIATYFAPLGYPRTIDNLHGRDSAVTFMAPPFNQAPAGLAYALSSTYQTLLRPNGGVIPGNDHDIDWVNSWTPSTAMFALAWSGLGMRGPAEQVLDWLIDHRNMLGDLPEQVDPQGDPASVAPLTWTDALAVLTISQLDGNLLPVPPGPQ
jgi:glucoamylase